MVRTNLTDADLTDARLTDANMGGAIIAGARLENALIAGANLTTMTPGGFTKEQLYSTASYRNGNLRDVALDGNDLSGWDFRWYRSIGFEF